MQPPITAVLLALLVVTGCSNDSWNSGTSLASSIQLAVTDRSWPTFPADPIGGVGRIVCVDGQQLRVFEFADVAQREAAASRIDPHDASHVGSAIVEWEGKPRIWAHDALLIMYAGDNEAAAEQLRAE